VRTTTRAFAEVDNVESKTEGHDEEAVDAERERSPLCESRLVAEEAEVELRGLEGRKTNSYSQSQGG
jgi:hypothetical protein